jgi:hypothetical protein
MLDMSVSLFWSKDSLLHSDTDSPPFHHAAIIALLYFIICSTPFKEKGPLRRTEGRPFVFATIGLSTRYHRVSFLPWGCSEHR